MARWKVEPIGRVLALSSHRGRAARLCAMLEQERFSVHEAAGLGDAEVLAAELSPTVVVIDWSPDDDPARATVLHRLGPRRSGARLVVIAAPAELEALRALPSVSGVVDSALEVEELIDAVWRAHHATLDARATRDHRTGGG